MANKKKVTTAIVAGVTAVALVLGGTFAWTSISQQARNEAVVDINPGGRLHDDFNGTNKDVYVENFSSGATGVPIYARIRLDQYMEIGQQAGDKTATDKKATSIISGDNINTPAEWETYIPGKDNVIDSTNPFFKYWEWNLGNDDSDMPYYMPTFNKNKDSLAADINGTYEGTVEGDRVHYDNYKVYDANSAAVTADATYDWDDDTDEDYELRQNENDPWDSADIYKVEETHTATQISSTADVILMKDWLDMSEEERKACTAWVYDTDGWAYWSQAIQPGETTGLLLTGIEQVRVPDDSWYYGINVVGQFVTSSDVSAFENEGGSLTDGAKELLGFAAEIEANLTVSGSTAVQPGKTYNYTAAMTRAGMAVDTPEDLTWSVKIKEEYGLPGDYVIDGDLTVGGDSEDKSTVTGLWGGTITINEKTGELAVGAFGFGTTFNVTATTADGVTDSVLVTIVDSWQSQVDAAEVGTTATVNIDGIDWFVLAKEDGRALMQAAEPVETMSAFGYDDMWWNSTSGVAFDNYLNERTDESLDLAQGLADEGGYTWKTVTPLYFTLTDMQASIVPTTYYALDLGNMAYPNNPNTYYALENRVGALPTVHDFECITGYFNDYATDDEKNRTYNGTAVITDEMLAIMLAHENSGGMILTRTHAVVEGNAPAATYDFLAVKRDGAGGYTTESVSNTTVCSIYPMLWVQYEPEKELTISSQNEEGVYYNGEIYAFDANLNDVTWSVSGGNGSSRMDYGNQLVIDVSEENGAALTVTATSVGGQTASITVTVTKVTELYLYYNDIAYKPGSEIQLAESGWFTARGNGGEGVVASVSYEVTGSSINASIAESTTYFDSTRNELILGEGETGTDGKLTLTLKRISDESVSNSFTIILPAAQS